MDDKETVDMAKALLERIEKSCLELKAAIKLHEMLEKAKKDIRDNKTDDTTGG